MKMTFAKHKNKEGMVGAYKQVACCEDFPCISVKEIKKHKKSSFYRGCFLLNQQLKIILI